MQRWGPRGTIPPPSERHKAGPRWTLQVIVGVCVVAAAFFGMRLLRHEPPPSPEEKSTPPAQSVDVAQPEEAPEAPSGHASVPGVLDAAFVARLRRADTYRLLGEIEIAADIRTMIDEQRIAEAARALDTQARANDRAAIVALSRLARACVQEGPGTQRPIESTFSDAAQRARDMPNEARRRIEASIAFLRERQATMQRACADTRFDAMTIAEQLQRAAAAGDEGSLWELGNQASAEAQRKRWTSAAMLGYVPAQISLAESLMAENSNNDPRQREQLSYWLTAAARQSSHGKVLLAECLLAGCSVKPPDGATAATLLQDAALSGAAEALAALDWIGGDDPAAPSDVQLLSLNAFRQRLNELGCYGELYPNLAVSGAENQRQLALRLSPSGLDEAHTLTEDYWRTHGAQARNTLHCD